MLSVRSFPDCQAEFGSRYPSNMAVEGFDLAEVGSDDEDDDGRLVGKDHGLNIPLCGCDCLSSLTVGVNGTLFEENILVRCL